MQMDHVHCNVLHSLEMVAVLDTIVTRISGAVTKHRYMPKSETVTFMSCKMVPVSPASCTKDCEVSLNRSHWYIGGGWLSARHVSHVLSHFKTSMVNWLLHKCRSNLKQHNSSSKTSLTVYCHTVIHISSMFRCCYSKDDT